MPNVHLFAIWQTGAHYSTANFKHLFAIWQIVTHRMLGRLSAVRIAYRLNWHERPALFFSANASFALAAAAFAFALTTLSML